MTRDELIRELLVERFGPVGEVARERRRPAETRTAPPHPLARERQLVDAIRRYQTNPIPTATSTEERAA